MKLYGAITISRVSCNNPEREYMRIHLQDVASRTTAIDIEMSMEDFALALTGMGKVDCEFEIDPLAPIGKFVEGSSKLLPKLPFDATEEDAKEALKPYEKDGWKGDAHSYINSHNFIDDKCSVTFRRYVMAEDET